MEQSQLL